MKIAVIAHAHFDIAEPYVGGLEAHTHQMVLELMRTGHDVTMYAKSGSDKRINVIPIFTGNAQGGAAPGYDAAYRYAMRHIRASEYDLIINNNLHWSVLLDHTPDMTPMITIFHTPPIREMVEVLQNKPTQSNQTFLAVSELTASQWQPSVGDKIHVVPNGIDIDSWDYHDIRPAFDTAVWMGRITPEKGTHIAVEACVALGLPLTIGGAIYDCKYFDVKIAPHLNNELIEYVGHISQRTMNKLYMDATVALVTPVWDEPFGLVAIEAMASGTPVAALPNGALPSIVNRSVGSLSTDDSVVEYIKAIKQAMHVDRLTCRQEVETYYTLEMMVESYLSYAPELVVAPRPLIDPTSLFAM